MSNRYIPVGEIVGTHGIAGWLKVKSFNSNSTALLSIREISLTDGTHSETYTLGQAKPHKRIVLLKLKGVDRIEAAEQLVGHECSVPEDALRPLGDDEYYYHDVIGFDVFDTETNYLGKVARVWLKEGGDLYVVDGTKKEYLIPSTKEIIEEVDLSNQRIIVDLPDGLLDL